MPKRKCTFTDSMKTKYPGFRPGRYDWEAECITCGSGTFISVANKGALDLKAHIEKPKHIKNVRGESSSAKVTELFVSPGSKIDESVSAAEGEGTHNANTERVFSLMQSQWTKERNKLLVESVKGLLLVQHNFKHMSCRDFHAYLMRKPKLLKALRSSNKYD